MTKIFFGINITENKNNERMDGDDFITARIPGSQAQALENSEEAQDKLQNKAKLPLPLRILQYLCAFISLCFIVGIVRGLGNVTLQQAFHNAPWLFYILPFTSCLPGALLHCSRAANRSR